MQPSIHATGQSGPDRHDRVADDSGPLSIGVMRNPRSHRNQGATSSVANLPGVIIADPPNKDGITAELIRMKRAAIDLLVIDGGDGTVRDVLTRGLAVFGDSWPRLMVLPKGKTNALAVDLGMSGKVLLADLVADLGSAHNLHRHPLLLERVDAPSTPLVGFIMGTGMFNTAIDAGQIAHRFGAFQGLAVGAAAAIGIFQSVLGIGKSPWRSTSETRIRLGQERRELPNPADPVGGRRFTSGYSTLERFPLGMKPFAREPGPIRYLVMDRPLRRTMAMAPAILMGMDRPILKRLGVHRGSTDEIELTLSDRFILDGEGYPAGTWRIKLGPRLEFLVP